MQFAYPRPSCQHGNSQRSHVTLMGKGRRFLDYASCFVRRRGLGARDRRHAPCCAHVSPPPLLCVTFRPVLPTTSIWLSLRNPLYAFLYGDRGALIFCDALSCLTTCVYNPESLSRRGNRPTKNGGYPCATLAKGKLRGRTAHRGTLQWMVDISYVRHPVGH